MIDEKRIAEIVKELRLIEKSSDMRLENASAGMLAEMIESLQKTLTAHVIGASHLKKRIVRLEDKLAESQRREQAAVEDLYTACTRSPCNSGICVKKNCTGNIIPCDFEWRGPQESGVFTVTVETKTPYPARIYGRGPRIGGRP